MTHTHRLVPALCALALGAALAPGVAHGLTSATADNGATWQTNDARRPGLDTGSIRNVSNSRLEAFGNLFVKVTGGSDPMNGRCCAASGSPRSLPAPTPRPPRCASTE